MKITKTVEEATKLFDSNQGLAYFTLNRNYPYYKMDEDYRQEAALGLWKACLTYDDSLNVKFSTYGVACVHGHLKTLFSKNKELQNGIEIISLDYAYTDAMSNKRSTFADKLITNADIDLTAMYCEEILEKLKPEEASLLMGVMCGNSFKTISAKIGKSKYNLQIKFRKIIQKLQFYKSRNLI